VDSHLFCVWTDATVIAHQFDPARGSDPTAKEAIVRLPVDTSAMVLVAMATPEPVVDFTTRQPKADPDGQPLYTVQVAAMYDDQGEVLAVKVAGQPAGIRPGMAVEVAGLVAQPWALGERSGVSYRAAAIRPADGAKGGERAATARAAS
jgi:hypothetical protein